MAAARADVDAVIHSAGVSQAASGLPDDDYRVLNTEATIGLARAAQRAGVQRFVFLSSIRAQCGPTAMEILTEDIPPKPTDPFGSSKLAAERGLADVGLDWVALRLMLVYGPGAQGNMGRLIRLARSPYPLPLGSLEARRALLSLDNLAAAINCVLAAPVPLRRPLIVADPDPLSVAQMIAALRRGLGRGPGLVRVPSWLLQAVLKTAGLTDSYDRLARPLVADASALAKLGCAPLQRTALGLELLMRGSLHV